MQISGRYSTGGTICRVQWASPAFSAAWIADAPKKRRGSPATWIGTALGLLIGIAGVWATLTASQADERHQRDNDWQAAIARQEAGTNANRQAVLTCVSAALALLDQAGQTQARTRSLIDALAAGCERPDPGVFLARVRAVIAAARTSEIPDRAMISGRAIPDPVASGSASLDPIVDSTGGQLSNVEELVKIAAGSGPISFRRHVDSPSANELRKAIGPGVLDNGLLAFPTMEGYLDRAEGPFAARF